MHLSAFYDFTSLVLVGRELYRYQQSAKQVLACKIHHPDLKRIA